MGDSTVSWREFMAETVMRFQQGGVDEPEISARRIIEEASGWHGAELSLHLEEPGTERSVAHLDSMVARRLTGEPLQYVLGRWSFRMLDLMVDGRVLIPRPETEEVAGLAISEARRRALDATVPVVVDLGTGSGAIGLSVAVEVPVSQVHLTDSSEDSLILARANTAGVGRPGTRVSIHHGSWFDALPPHLKGVIDVVVSNPPYVSEADPLPAVVADWEPSSALLAGADGLDDIRMIVADAPRWLAPGGALILEMAPHQTDEVAGLCRAAGFEATEIHIDLAGKPRAITAS